MKKKKKSTLKKAGDWVAKGAAYYIGFSLLLFIVFAIITTGVAVAANRRKASTGNGSVGAAGTKAKKAPDPKQVNAAFAAKMQRVLASLESDNVVLRSHYEKANANEKEAIEQKLAKNARKANELKKLIPKNNDNDQDE
ncbi:hypothetical protein SAMN05421780_1242 [Flexibacter flexilis DSM 6793]|uniref:Uncharacterized protein n=1 Tax=Flexibacter flexilis DSM 6793 TaxID=927664 RepID=A0A1I1NXM8_9BACT|nr:hypothetical protein [Flexibacter flexilis]SFD02434.1 hypothetical protein SAMN05421780_1242 [Flexibacter flexilis DSM 6793]